MCKRESEPLFEQHKNKKSSPVVPTRKKNTGSRDACFKGSQRRLDHGRCAKSKSHSSWSASVFFRQPLSFPVTTRKNKNNLGRASRTLRSLHHLTCFLHLLDCRDASTYFFAANTTPRALVPTKRNMQIHVVVGTQNSQEPTVCSFPSELESYIFPPRVGGCRERRGVLERVAEAATTHHNAT